MRRMLKGLLVIVAATLLADCTAIRREQARSMGDYLQEAGFTIRQADTAAAMQKLQAMPPGKMVKRLKDGVVVYTYADPYDCKCVYVGNQAQYTRYMEVRHGEEMAAAQIDTQQMEASEEQATMDTTDTWWWW